MQPMPERETQLTVVCGEALIDLFVTALDTGGLEIVPRLGGAPYNLAVGLARMGQPVALCAGMSSDIFGVALRRQLLSEGVSDEFLEEYVEPTMLVVIGRTADGRPIYGFPVTTSADRQLAGQRFDGPHTPVGTLVLGSHLMVVPATQSRLLRIVQAKCSGMLICLDPNIRLGIITDARMWRDAFEKFLPYVDLVKASDEDIAALYPEFDSVDAAATAWLHQGVRLVIVTMGAGGATAYFGSNNKLEVPGEVVDIVDTVGAGDSFLAALLTSLREQHFGEKATLAEIESEAMAQAMRFSIAAATITCGRRGADLPDRATVVARLVQTKHTLMHKLTRIK